MITSRIDPPTPVKLALASAVTLLVASSAAARPPTAGEPHIGVGYAFGETFARGLNPYRHGLTFRAGITFLNGLYLGALTDVYLGDELQGTATANALLFGGALGLDLKMSASVSGRLTVMGGMQETELTDLAPLDGSLDAARARSGSSPFAGPSLEMVLLVGDLLYLAPAARLNVFLTEDLPLLTTFSVSVGLSI